MSRKRRPSGGQFIIYFRGISGKWIIQPLKNDSALGDFYLRCNECIWMVPGDDDGS
jgi:hypothetical protein